MVKSKRGRPPLGKEVIRFTVTATKEECEVLSAEAERSGKSLARFVIERSVFSLHKHKEPTEDITKNDLQFMQTIIDEVGAPIKFEVLLNLLGIHLKAKQVTQGES